MSCGPGPAQGVDLLWLGFRCWHGLTDICVQVTPANYVHISLEFIGDHLEAQKTCRDLEAPPAGIFCGTLSHGSV